jgi:DNA-binding NarL/FixJ family response regulator
MTKLSVFLADDHAVVREGLKMLINGQTDMEVVGEAGDGRTALSRATELRPSVALLDISMPDLNGAAVAQQLKQACPEVRVAALTVQQDRVYVRQLLAAGATGYILKLARPVDFLQAIRTVGAGGVYIHPGVMEAAIPGLTDAAAGGKQLQRPALTARETELLQLFAKGYNNKEIAERLDLAAKTVETYKARVMEKLGFRSRVQVIQYAIHQGWLQLSEPL